MRTGRPGIADVRCSNGSVKLDEDRCRRQFHPKGCREEPRLVAASVEADEQLGIVGTEWLLRMHSSPILQRHRCMRNDRLTTKLLSQRTHGNSHVGGHREVYLAIGPNPGVGENRQYEEKPLPFSIVGNGHHIHKRQ